MAWCPECEAEYKNDLLECPYCGSKLVGDLLETTGGKSGEPPTSNSGDDPADHKEPIIPRFLISAPEIIRANLVESLLQEAEIPFFRKDSRNGGAYIKAYTGNTFYGEDIFVDNEDYDRAKELIDGYFSEPAEINSDPASSNSEDPMENRGENRMENKEKPAASIFKRVMKLFIAILLITAAAAFLYEAITLLLKIFLSKS